MSSLLQKIMIALGRRGVQTPINGGLANAYEALRRYHEEFPSVFPQATEILLAEIEGGATNLADIPARLANLTRMLDRLHKQEELAEWSEDLPGSML